MSWFLLSLKYLYSAVSKKNTDVRKCKGDHETIADYSLYARCTTVQFSEW